MGNSASSGRAQDETVDFGALVPQGVYTGPRDWAHQVVAQAIVDRRLAPFYRPLEDYEEGWSDDQILQARKEPPPPPETDEPEGSARQSHAHAPAHHHKAHGKKASTTGKGKEQATLNEASLYHGAVECPICFLYYPPNINYSRCCAQALCTECFVQIKRAEPDAQHLESTPAACPYCVRSDFGVVYKPPSWRAGIGSEGHIPPSPSNVNMPAVTSPGERKRRQSIGANDPQVVTTDYIRPDWQAKVDAVKAAVARRAARRIIMRQVGDRLVPIGISSGRAQVIDESAGAADSDGSRRQRRRDREISRMLGLPGFSSANYPGGVVGTQDLEELMMAEALRQSVLDEEERQRKEKDKDKDKTAKPGAPAPEAGPSLPAVTGASLLPPPTDERGRPGHRPSSSISALAPPDAPQPGAARARSQPPFSALSAALRGAASAATAIAGPGRKREGGSGSSTPGIASEERTTTPRLPTPPGTAPPVAEPVRIYAAEPGPAPMTPADASDLAALAAIPARPIPTHADSFASVNTVDSEATVDPYDMLSSSPESDAGTTSLLRGEAPLPLQTPGLGEGGPLGEPQTPGVAGGRPLGEA